MIGKQLGSVTKHDRHDAAWTEVGRNLLLNSKSGCCQKRIFPNMIHSHKRLVCTTLIGCLLIACQVGTALTPTIDLAAVKTSAVETAYSELTAITPELTPSFTRFPTSTAFPTLSPMPAAIANLLPVQCTPQPGVFIENFPSQEFLLQQYGNMGCKLPVLSPNQKLLAYVTLAREESATGPYFLDVVRLLDVSTKPAKDQEVHLAFKLDYIAALEWSPTGQLIIRESIWEGPWVIFVYDPVSNSIVSTMRLDTFGKLKWNPTHTALYAKHSFIYGADQCITELGGYDFEHHSRFPNFYQIYKLEESKDAPFGIPHGENNELAVEPFSWSQDGKRLWITVTPLNWKEGQYELGPKQAGVLEFSTSQVTYKVLAADAHLDYSFEGTPEPVIVSNPYQGGTCP